MGQAKRRGTFEQRQAEGIFKRKQAELAKLAARRLREEARTPEGMAALRRARMIMAWAAGQGML